MGIIKIKTVTGGRNLGLLKKYKGLLKIQRRAS
jgi:hypothetical protein